MDQAIQKLLENAGILGPIVIFLGWYIWAKDKQIKALQDKLDSSHESRIKDAQEVQDQLLEFNKNWAEALNANTSTMNEMKTLLMLIRERRPDARR